MIALSRNRGGMTSIDILQRIEINDDLSKLARGGIMLGNFNMRIRKKIDLSNVVQITKIYEFVFLIQEMKSVLFSNFYIILQSKV